MSKLDSRIAQLEIRLRALRPPPPRYLHESWEFEWATDPEEFRRRAMEPDRFQSMMQGIMKSPIPMGILRFIAFEQLREEARQQKQRSLQTGSAVGCRPLLREVKHRQPSGGSPPAADSQVGDLSVSTKQERQSPTADARRACRLEVRSMENMTTNQELMRTHHVAPAATGPTLPGVTVVTPVQPAASRDGKEKR